MPRRGAAARAAGARGQQHAGRRPATQGARAGRARERSLDTGHHRFLAEVAHRVLAQPRGHARVVATPVPQRHQPVDDPLDVVAVEREARELPREHLRHAAVALRERRRPARHRLVGGAGQRLGMEREQDRDVGAAQDLRYVGPHAEPADRARDAERPGVPLQALGVRRPLLRRRVVDRSPGDREMCLRNLPPEPGERLEHRLDPLLAIDASRERDEVCLARHVERTAHPVAVRMDPEALRIDPVVHHVDDLRVEASRDPSLLHRARHRDEAGHAAHAEPPLRAELVGRHEAQVAGERGALEPGHRAPEQRVVILVDADHVRGHTRGATDGAEPFPHAADPLARRQDHARQLDRADAGGRVPGQEVPRGRVAERDFMAERGEPDALVEHAVLLASALRRGLLVERHDPHRPGHVAGAGGRGDPASRSRASAPRRCSSRSTTPMTSTTTSCNAYQRFGIHGPWLR